MRERIKEHLSNFKKQGKLEVIIVGQSLFFYDNSTNAFLYHTQELEYYKELADIWQ